MATKPPDVTLKCPATSSGVAALVVPIPTFPLESIPNLRQEGVFEALESVEGKLQLPPNGKELAITTPESSQMAVAFPLLSMTKWGSESSISGEIAEAVDHEGSLCA